MINSNQQTNSRAQVCVNEFFVPYTNKLFVGKTYYTQRRVQIWLIFDNGFRHFWIHDSQTNKGMKMADNWELAKEVRQEIEDHLEEKTNG